MIQIVRSSDISGDNFDWVSLVFLFCVNTGLYAGKSAEEHYLLSS